MRVEDVQAFLRTIDDGSSILGSKSWALDRSDCRAHFMERIEAGGTWWMPVWHARWSDEIDFLAEVLERLPTEQLARKDQAFARAVIDSAVAGPRDDSIEKLEASRVLGLCLREGVLTRRYCEEVRLLARDRKTVSALGQALLGLSPVDALGWVLLVESEQSTGSWHDRWRVSRDVLEQLLDGLEPQFEPSTDEVRWALSPRTFSRLQGFGLVTAWIDDDEGDGSPHRIEVRSALREPVRAVLANTAWQVAIRTALADEQAWVLPLVRQSAVQGAHEQIRLVTHEVRNALVPARHHLEVLSKGAALEPHRVTKALEGVKRTLHFIDQMVATAEMLAPKPLPIEVEDLMKRALSMVDSPERVSLVSTPGTLRLTIDRVAAAISNVLSNALQATGVSRVTFTAHAAASIVTLTVDDDGHGVPADLRERIFSDGFTTRPEGTGFGLAFARKVIEENLGSIRCERSDLGGARFVITLPLVETSR